MSDPSIPPASAKRGPARPLDADRPSGPDPVTGRVPGSGAWSVADWTTQLDPALAHEVRELLRSPADLLGRLRADPELLVAMARADVRSHLVGWLSPVDDWAYDPVGTGPVGESAVGVEWTYGGVHDLDLAFNGTHATGRPVVVRGYTRFAAVDGRFAVRRYVDWAGAFAQLGLTLNWRVPVRTVDGPGPRADRVAEG